MSNYWIHAFELWSFSPFLTKITVTPWAYLFIKLLTIKWCWNMWKKSRWSLTRFIYIINYLVVSSFFKWLCFKILFSTKYVLSLDNPDNSKGFWALVVRLSAFQWIIICNGWSFISSHQIWEVSILSSPNLSTRTTNQSTTPSLSLLLIP